MNTCDNLAKHLSNKISNDSALKIIRAVIDSGIFEHAARVWICTITSGDIRLRMSEFSGLHKDYPFVIPPTTGGELISSMWPKMGVSADNSNSMEKRFKSIFRIFTGC